MTDDAHLDIAFSALAHPTRRAILSRLSKGAATVNELAEPFEATLPAISQHIRVLEAAGLITRSKEAQFRPCTLNPEPLEAVTRWTDQCRQVWEHRFDAMDGVIQEMKDKSHD